MGQGSSSGIDESTLTKGQVRKLKALRKSVGEENRRAGVRRVAVLAVGGGRGEGGRERGDDRRYVVAPG